MVAACAFPSTRGSQVLIRELAQSLAQRGHEVHLVTYPYGENLVPIHGIFVHRARAPRFAMYARGLGWRKLVLDVCLALELHRVVRRRRIDVIHAHNYEGPLIGYLVRLLTGVPVVYHSHNALEDELACYFGPGWRRLAQRVGKILDRQIPRRADFSVALTSELEGFLRARGVAAYRIATVPPGGGLPPLMESSADNQDPFPGRFAVTYAGNLDPYQDLDVLVRAFETFRERVPSALLTVVTHEAGWVQCLGRRFQALVEAGDACAIVAPTFHVVRRFLARADVLVCPRSSWSGYPIKLINYMASGRPIVAAQGSAKGIVDGETGLIFRDHDARDLAAVLDRLFMDAPLRQRLGQQARLASGAANGWARVAAQISRVYEQVLAPATTDLTGHSQSTARRETEKARLMNFPSNRIGAASSTRLG